MTTTEHAHIHLAHNGKSKIDRYKWMPADRPGEFQMIDKHLIRVDPSYQRDVRDKKALTIASEFSWPAFGVLIIGRRTDGTLWAVDGQHRIAGAMRRSDISLVPCMVFSSLGANSEAVDFLNANTLRRPVNAIEKFRAQLMTQDPTAVFVSGLIADAGRVPSETSSASTVRCVALMMGMAAQPRTRDALLRVWPVVVSACTGGIIAADVLDGLVYIEANLPRGITIACKRWSDRVVALGPTELARGARAGAVFHGRGGPKSYASGIIQLINKNLASDRRLSLKEEEISAPSPGGAE